MADRAEGTFVLLRYSLGGDRPSQTDRLPLFLCLIQGERLDFSTPKGGISLAAPQPPKGLVQSLPLMLSIEIEKPVTAYS